MWFNNKDIVFNKPLISLDDLHGYVLPHGGTEFTGGIIAHTLRFRPTKSFTKVLILYYPASEVPDIDDTYYHEYYIPWKSLELAFGTKEYIGYNINDKQMPTFIPSDTLIVVSADFAHFLPMSEALDLENKAAHILMFRQVDKYLTAVDDIKTFRALYKIIPPEWILQWIGHTRSKGIKAVGYLSFLIRLGDTLKTSDNKRDPVKQPLPNGMFVTAFSQSMTARECLGEWFNAKKWSPTKESNLIDKVLRLGRTTSRLTGGTELDVPLSNYTVTYLYKTSDTKFIRGWHGIFQNSFFLPEVFLENTYENGYWIKPTDTEWRAVNIKSIFDLKETLSKLDIKAGLSFNGGTRKKNRRYKKRSRKHIISKYKIKGGNQNYILYNSSVMHYSI